MNQEALAFYMDGEDVKCRLINLEDSEQWSGHEGSGKTWIEAFENLIRQDPVADYPHLVKLSARMR